MSGDYQRIVTEDLRLCILRVLAQDQDNQVNSSIIQTAVDVYGHRYDRDRIHTELNWLSEQGAVETETMASVVVATLTQRGQDHLDRRTVIAGVKRPGLG